MSSSGLIEENSSLISSVHLYQENLSNFENDIANETDIHKRECRWNKIEEKIRQILSIREQIYQIRYSHLERKSKVESLKSLFHALHDKEKELNQLQEKDRFRFIESLHLERLNETENSLTDKKALSPVTNVHNEFEYAKTHDFIPEKAQSSNARSAWRRLINGAHAATKFMRIQSQSQKDRVYRAHSFIVHDPCKHSTGRALTKIELRDRIDEVRALIRELKLMKNETAQEKKMISQLSKKLRQMDSVYSEMLLHESNPVHENVSSAY